jgi:hypothetical protein
LLAGKKRRTETFPLFDSPGPCPLLPEIVHIFWINRQILG